VLLGRFATDIPRAWWLKIDDLQNSKFPTFLSRTASNSTVFYRPMLLKNSISVQRRFFSFTEMQPKIRGKHDTRPTEKDGGGDRQGWLFPRIKEISGFLQRYDFSPEHAQQGVFQQFDSFARY
jgi:hypothetical protein